MPQPSADSDSWDLAGLLPPGPASVLIDGDGPEPGILAGRLAATLNAVGTRAFTASWP